MIVLLSFFFHLSYPSVLFPHFLRVVLCMHCIWLDVLFTCYLSYLSLLALFHFRKVRFFILIIIISIITITFTI
ncbi:hypothetical protein BDW42DRAFT_181537, partial [Aspergillus taichungensis]